ncbi:MAG: nucleotidyl transferase AbiEii/AbiGii toxin family protein [Thermoplasmatota archaeon]
MVAIDAAELAEAIDEGFRQVTAEKVHRLMGVLRAIEARTDTRGLFTLKGGTALNIFHLKGVPRLSVDIDIIATGFPQAGARSPVREQTIRHVEDLVHQLGYKTARSDSEDSGCTIYCKYTNALGAPDQIKIDIDFLGRQTLLPTEAARGPKMFLADDFAFPILACPELLAQKLVAVAYRAHPRDLYDMHRMIGEGWHELPRAREMYLAQSFLRDHEWYRLSYPVQLKVPYDADVLADVLRGNDKAPTLTALRDEARAALHPRFTQAVEADQALRKALLAGDRSAFARIAGESDPAREALLMASPALAWRLRQAKPR